MAGRIVILIVAAIQVCWLASGASGQDSASGTLPNLQRRLEQFRQDLVGEPPARNTDYPGRGVNPQRAQNGPQPKLAPRKQAPASDDDAASSDVDHSAGTKQNGGTKPRAVTTPNVGTINSAVSTPSRMEVQTARRASPNLDLNSDNGSSPAQVPPAELKKRSDTQSVVKKASPTKRALVERPPVAPEQADEEEKSDPELEKPQVVKSLPHKSSAPKKLPSESAQISAPKSEPKNESANSGSGVLFTSHSPALAVEIAGPRRVMIGKEAQFIVKIVNSGAAANDVVVSVNVPNYAEVLSTQASVGSAQPPAPGEQHESLQWTISRLEAKSTETLNLRLVPRKSAPLDLGVKWTFTPEASQAMVEVQEPKLAMSISGPEEVLFGQSKIYKLIVSNPGNGDSENVMVGLLPVGGAGESLANHRLGTLHAGESKTIDIELTARQAGAITIKAQAFADGGLRSEATEQVLVRRANLLIEVEAPRVKYAGTVGTYHVKIVNAGNATAENVQVAAMLPPDSKYVACGGGGRLEAQQGKVKWAVGTLPPGAERRFELQCSLSAPGDNRMQFVSMADGNLNAAAMSSTRVEAIADLKLEVRDPQGPIAVAEDTIYEVHIRNRGTKAAEGVDLTVFFSDGLEATTVDGGPHEIGPGQVAFRQIAALPAGEVVIYRVHARADKAGNHVFRAEVACASLNTKLATEETTHFYGDEKPASAEIEAEPAATAPNDSTSASNDPPPERP